MPRSARDDPSAATSKTDKENKEPNLAIPTTDIDAPTRDTPLKDTEAAK
jgi:hypothetical protein